MKHYFHSETLLIGYISLLTKKNNISNVHSRYKREYINYKFGSLANRLTQYKAHQMQDKKDYTVQVKKSTEIKSTPGEAAIL